MTDDAISLPDAPDDLRARLEGGAAIAWREPVEIRTYEPREPDRFPMYFDRRVYQGSSGRVYPLPFTDGIQQTPVARRWDAIHLENRWIRLMVMPELGGRIHIGYDKAAGNDFFYRNNVIKPALVGLAGPWISGGVEFNWPQHHRPATFLPVETCIEQGDDGSVTVWCSDHDPFTRMKGMHGVRLHPDRAVVELVGRLHNRTDEPQTFHWWANVAAPGHDAYQAFFPTDVRYVADHARRAITSYPAADRPYYAVDYPARHADGGDRLDFPRNIPVPTSYMITDTEDDFFGGYDHRAHAGFVHVADRFVAPGKKLWTWGEAEFGHTWNRHLTDADGPYIELMAGVYTDNQPDFAWLEPGETKAFSQAWYPIQEIGTVQQANLDAAVHLASTTDRIDLGVCVTAVRAGVRVSVTVAGERVYDEQLDLAPGRPLVRTIAAAVGGPETVEVTVVHEGRMLLAWRPRIGEAAPPWVAEVPDRPDAIATAEELYLTGVHLQQFRHPTRSPVPYWEEALRRDPGDARCNLALAWHRYERADYASAQTHAERALTRLTRRNANPRDGEAAYLAGLIAQRQGRRGRADELFAKAAWDERWRAAASLHRARLAAAEQRWGEALRLADESLARRPDDSRSLAARVVALRALGRMTDAAAALSRWRARDPLDQTMRALGGEAYASDGRTILDVALELHRSGDVGAAIAVASRAAAAPPTAAGSVAPIAHYHRACMLDALGRGDEAAAARGDARRADPTRCFPSGLDDHDALRAALRADPADARAAALLALLLVDRGREVDALPLWEAAFAQGLSDAVAWRTAAIVVYNLRGDAATARQWYAAAAAVDPSARLVYEQDQLLARLGVPAHERLALLEARSDALADGRDDLTVSWSRLLVDCARPAEAVRVLEAHRFSPWEGGEGQAIAAWEKALAAVGDGARERGDLEEAIACAERAIRLPPSLGEVRHPLTDTRALHERWAVLLEAAGRPDEAARVRAAAVRSEVEPVAASVDDDEVDFFATSLPDLLLFTRTPAAGPAQA